MTLANPNEQSLSNGVGESESASVESEQVKWALDFGRFPEKKRVWKAWILYLLVFVCVFVQKFPTSPRRRNFQTKNSAQNFLPIKSVSQSYICMNFCSVCAYKYDCVCVWDFLLLLYDNITSSQLLLTTLFLLFVHRFKINISRLTETSTEQQLQKLPCCRRRCFIIIIEVVVVVLMYGWNHLFFPQKNVC